MQKYVQQATANLRENYECADEFNKCVAQMTANIDNTRFTNEHTYSFETFSAALQDAFTILNDNYESHSWNQMVGKTIEKIKVRNNS